MNNGDFEYMWYAIRKLCSGEEIPDEAFQKLVRFAYLNGYDVDEEFNLVKKDPL